MLIHRGVEGGELELTVALEGFQAQAVADISTLADDTWYGRNTLAAPDRISPQPQQVSVADGHRVTLSLPPFSLTRVILKAKG